MVRSPDRRLLGVPTSGARPTGSWATLDCRIAGPRSPDPVDGAFGSGIDTRRDAQCRP